MKTRMSMGWTAAAAMASIGFAADAPRPAINYNFSDSGLPAPAMLKSAKPTESAKPAAKAKLEALPALPAAAPVKSEPLKAAASAVELPKLQSWTPDPLPPTALKAPPAMAPKSEVVTESAIMKHAVEPAVMKPEATAPVVMPVAYMPPVEDYEKCVACLKTLSGSPIESDRKAALAEMSRNSAWTKMKSAYMILRRVALTEYNTKMRADAVKLLGEARMEHAMAADTLKLSAMYDSDASIRTAAMATLERMAAMPPDRVMR
jgi:hypothetical protein